MNNIMQFIEDHIWTPNHRDVYRSDNTVTHYKVIYNNGDTFEYKSVHPTMWKEHTQTWINGELIEECDYEWHNFGWRRIA